jgi:predicted DNA-binding ribbon-helix-helix protein
VPPEEFETLPGREVRTDGRRTLGVELKDADYETLKTLADRHRLSMTALVREILASYLKYR